jgi:hypothetical protein
MPVASLLLASLPTHYNAVLAAASSVPLLLVWQSTFPPPAHATRHCIPC